MTARKQTNRRPKSSTTRKRRRPQKQSSELNFEKLEARQLLAAITVGNATDILSPAADTSSIVALVDNDGGDGISLREAIAAANNTVGEDAITFDAGVFTGGDNSLIRLTQGQLSIGDNLSIDATSVGGVVITGDADGDDITFTGTNVTDVEASSRMSLLNDNSPVLHFQSPTFGPLEKLTLTGLTITGGRSTTDGGGSGVQFYRANLILNESVVSGNSVMFSSGGAIYTRTGSVYLYDSTVSDNVGDRGGGGISTSSGDVFLMNSIVSDNTINVALNRSSGGGIRTTSGRVTLTGSTVSGNSTNGYGGGISTGSGYVVLTDSTVSGNRSSYGDGGGIYTNDGFVSLTDSRVSNNISNDHGGGIYSRSGTVSLTSSTVSGNTATTGDGGGVFTRNGRVLLIDSNVSSNTSSDRGGGIYTYDGAVLLSNSTVSGNVSSSLGGGITTNRGTVSLTGSTVSGNRANIFGGGIAVATGFGDALSLTDSTVSGNSVTGGNGGLGGGGGIGTVADLILSNSTVSGNSSGNLGGGVLAFNSALFVNSTVTDNLAAVVGGGIFTASLTLSNSIVAGNTDDGTAPDAEVTGEAVNDLVVKHSLIGDTTGLEITATTGPGNILNQLPLLGPLEDNGGPTLTHALLPGSPAIDAGSNALALDRIGNPLTTDQRGDVRLQSVAVDIGAVEAGGGSLVVTTAQDVVDSSDGITSLREAIAFANRDGSDGGDSDGDGLIADTITFDASVFTGGDSSVIRLTQGELNIDESLTIDGSSVVGLVITGDAADDDITVPGTQITDVPVSQDLSRLNDNSRVLNFSAVSGKLLLSGLTITGGGSEVNGGGVYAGSGDVSFVNSTVSGNRTSGLGGGVATGAGAISLFNSTVSGNFSGGAGGGILSMDSTVMLVNSTVTGNSASGVGGGIVGAGLTLYNTIVAGNTDDGTAPDVEVVGDLVNSLVVEHSLIGATTGSGITAATGTGNLLNQSALLGPLSDNGGSMLTHALLPGSPAIDAGNNGLALDEDGSPLTTDQIGAGRILNNVVEIGAVEFGEELRSLVVSSALDVADPRDGLTSLREAIAFANDPTAGIDNAGDADGDGSVADTITFDASVFAGGDSSVIRLTQGELVINESLSIDGDSAGGVVVTGDANGDDVTIAGTRITDVSANFSEIAGDLLDDNFRVINFSSEAGNLSLAGLTLTGGRTTEDNAVTSQGYESTHSGGGIRFESNGSLMLNSVTVSGNSTSGSQADGGGIFSSGGDVVLNDSVVSRNNTTGSSADGGGIASEDGTLSLIGSSVSGNTSFRGGGIYSSGTLSLTSSTVSGNSSDDGDGDGGSSSDGGGIYSRGDASLTNSVVSGNTSDNDGGGIRSSDGTLSLINSTVSDNSSVNSGGGISARGTYIGIESRIGVFMLTGSTVSDNSSGLGGGISAAFGNASLTDSTVSGNSSGGSGGGIYFRGFFDGALNDVLSLTNSTVSGNSSGNRSGGNGGGISSANATILLVNSTLSGNVNSSGPGGGITGFGTKVSLINSTVTNNSASSVGGGIRLFLPVGRNDSEGLTLHNSIVAGNTDDGTAPDIEGVDNVVDDLVVEHSLIGDTTGSNITAATGSGNILNQSDQSDHCWAR